MWGKCSVMENILYLWGRRSNVFINFLWSVLLFNDYSINFIFIFKLSHTDGAGVTVVPYMAYRTTITMWLKVSNLLSSTPNLYNNICGIICEVSSDVQWMSSCPDVLTSSYVSMYMYTCI